MAVQVVRDACVRYVCGLRYPIRQGSSPGFSLYCTGALGNWIECGTSEVCFLSQIPYPYQQRGGDRRFYLSTDALEGHGPGFGNTRCGGGTQAFIPSLFSLPPTVIR